MAWQTPKTNWGAADGVRDSDLNRIEENIRLLHDGTAPFEDITLFVSTSGSDTTGNGSSTLPYASISKALLALPKNFNGANVSINIADGVYDETVVIRGYVGTLSLVGSSGSTASINSITIDDSDVRIENISIATTASPGFVVGGGATVVATGNLVLSRYGINAFDNSKLLLANVEVYDAVTAVSVYNNASLFMNQLYCSAINTGMNASNGGIITYSSMSGIVTGSRTVTSSGGRIYTGSQTSGGGGILADAEVV